nr:immunoglobulin superfamily member 1-like [Chelonoidis abingdonii]
MASALTVLLLGCWLAGQSRVSGEGSLPKPSISVSPGGVIPVRGNVTIRCRHQRLGMRFLLYKDGDGDYLTNTDPAGSEAEFPITSARREHGGNYTCRYTYRSGGTVYSEPSDPVQIIVAEKPADGEERDRAHHGLPGAAAPGAVPHSARTRASGSVEFSTGVWVAALRGPHCPIMVSALTVLLLSCWLAGHSGVWGAGREYHKPTIWVSPSRVVALGGSVTIRCEGLYPGMEFILRKAGHPNLQVRTAGDWTVAEFPIPSVGREDGGSYICDYRSITDQSRWSYLSDPVEIIAADFSNANIARLALAAAVLLVLGLILAEAYQSRPRGAPWLR